MSARIVAAPLEAEITVAVADRDLSAAMTEAIARALRDVTAACSAPAPRVVRLRTRKRFARLGAERIAGAIVVVAVTASNARRLLELVEAVRGAGASGVQLVWDGTTPARDDVERHVFAVLERARATPAGPPVVLAKDSEPAFSLRALVTHRARPITPNDEPNDEEAS